MKIRSLLALVGLAISFALPTLAQQTSTPDPELREQILALAKKFSEAFNNGDAAAMVALYSNDGVEVTDHGPIYGREALEKNYVDLFHKVHFSNHLTTVDQYSPYIIGTAGNEVWSTGQYSMTVRGENFGPAKQKGYWSMITVREGDTWKDRMLTWNVTPAPPAPAQTNAASTSAQEKSMVDPQVRQGIEALMMKFQEAFNNRDTATIGTLRPRTLLKSGHGQKLTMVDWLPVGGPSRQGLKPTLLQILARWSTSLFSYIRSVTPYVK